MKSAALCRLPMSGVSFDVLISTCANKPHADVCSRRWRNMVADAWHEDLQSPRSRYLSKHAAHVNWRTSCGAHLLGFQIHPHVELQVLGDRLIQLQPRLLQRRQPVLRHRYLRRSTWSLAQLSQMSCADAAAMRDCNWESQEGIGSFCCFSCLWCVSKQLLQACVPAGTPAACRSARAPTAARRLVSLAHRPRALLSPSLSDPPPPGRHRRLRAPADGSSPPLACAVPRGPTPRLRDGIGAWLPGSM